MPTLRGYPWQEVAAGKFHPRKFFKNRPSKIGKTSPRGLAFDPQGCPVGFVPVPPRFRIQGVEGFPMPSRLLTPLLSLKVFQWERSRGWCVDGSDFFDTNGSWVFWGVSPKGIFRGYPHHFSTAEAV